jgi:hypothetical protein
MYPYYDIQDGNYIWHTNADHAHFMGPQIAVFFDKSVGALLNHGVPNIVQMKYEKLREAYTGGPKGGAVDPDNLVLLVGRLPLEKVNKVISTSGICHLVFKEEISLISSMSQS